MTVKPILFSGPMVRALLEGRKTQTRRVLKSPRDGSGWYRHPETGAIINSMGGPLPTVPYAPGDLLWVRENAAVRYTSWNKTDGHRHSVDYAADFDDGGHYIAKTSCGAGIRKGEAPSLFPRRSHRRDGRLQWCPSIHMPRWASRLTLKVTDVRVQRLQDISEEDARAEGVENDSDGWRDYTMPHTQCCGSARDSFRTLWNSLNEERGFGWEANPWVVAVSFNVIHANVGTVLEREAVNVL